MKRDKIGFGGGCHWCTEAVFSVLSGVEKVDQGWISSEAPDNALSEAVVVWFDSDVIPLSALISIHLATHQSTSNHAMRKKYRSAIYTFSNNHNEAVKHLKAEQAKSSVPIVTKVIPYVAFKASSETYQDYYLKNPNKPFCTTYITPKLRMLMSQFKKHLNPEKILT